MTPLSGPRGWTVLCRQQHRRIPVATAHRWAMDNRFWCTVVDVPSLFLHLLLLPATWTAQHGNIWEAQNIQ